MTSPRRLPLWEIGSVLQLISLGIWLAFPELIWGVLAALLALLTVMLAAARRQPGLVAVGVVGLAGAGAALHASWQVVAVEERWPDVRERLIDQASQRLASTLGNAVATVELLAVRGAEMAPPSRQVAFSLLEGGLAGRTPERGVVVFDENGAPWAWAGNARLPMRPDGRGLEARVNDFYVVIEARAGRDRVAVSQIVLAADSAIPRRGETVAARFERATGSSLEFFAPNEAPPDADVFDYCLPSCNAEDVVPDTLFSVRPVPPSQGTLKLRLQDRGGRRVAIAAAVALVVLGIVGSMSMRWVVVVGAAAMMTLTPMGSRLGLGDLFSPSTYFVDIGRFSATAGTLIVIAALLLVAVSALSGVQTRTRTALIPAVALITATPFALRYFADGVTPPADGITLGTWIGWSLAISTLTTALLVVAGFLARVAVKANAPRSLPWIGSGWALVLSGVGLLTWQPEVGWAPWFTLLWLPAFALAVVPVSWRSLVLSAALVSGMSASLLTWGAVVNGRLLLAERDVQRFGPEADPLPIGLLEVMETKLLAAPVPVNTAGLFGHWSRSALSMDRYPATLITWDPAGRVEAELELASLNLAMETLRVLATEAAASGTGSLEEYTKVPGVHYVLSVPYDDGSVVTVAVGPRSRAVTPRRVARLLEGGQSVGAPPYTMELSDLQPMEESPRALEWRRDGYVIRGDQTLEVPGGIRHLHIEVELGRSVSNTLARGALLTICSCLIVALLWIAGEALAGRRSFQSWADTLWGGSYRGRLGVALGLFFLVPMVGFAVWGVGRLQAEVDRAEELLLRQSLQEAAGGAVNLPSSRGPRAQERLDELSDRLDADLILYENGELIHASSDVLAELALIDPYMPPAVYQMLVLDDQIETTADQEVGTQRTRVGYRSLRVTGGYSLVLAEPQLAAEAPVLADLDALLLATVLGIIAALWLATKAADSLSQPVQALSRAASAVGGGRPVPSFDPGTPKEFVPVVSAFERMARDVKAHQRALEEALQFTGAVLDNVATGVMTLDADMRVTTANPRAVALLESDPVSYQEVSKTTPPEWAPIWDWVREFVRRRLDTDASEFTVGERRIRVQVAALTTVEGGCVVALDDATELAMAERVLAWGEMARQVAHEIKNPLTPIRLGIQHLERAYRAGRGDFSATLGKTGQQILAEIERLDAIARAFSRFGAPPVQAAPVTDVDLAEVAEETASLYGLGGDTAVRVVSRDGRHSRLRRDELKEVLVNLIENARGANATEVVIEIATDGDDCSVLVVRDNGDGIPPEDIPRIFEPHFSTTTSGTGLGLAICKRLVESWGGSITAESHPGEGTIVKLCLQ